MDKSTFVSSSTVNNDSKSFFVMLKDSIRVLVADNKL